MNFLNNFIKVIRFFVIFFSICITAGALSVLALYIHYKPELPDVATLHNVELQQPLQIYSQDGKLMAEFGEKRRLPLTDEEIPKLMKDAIIATEDSRFYDHIGVDPIGIMRAIWVAAQSGTAKQGASTITQQLARNFFLSNEKSYVRKIKEAFLALEIERSMSKKEILDLYLNKIYLGQRAYGVGAAAFVYFGKDIKDLTLSEIAVLAGLPKAPSTYNPISSLKAATARRNTVLGRMLTEKVITKAQYDQAKSEAIQTHYHTTPIELYAPYVAEMARLWVINNYGEDFLNNGSKVYTTIRSDLQTVAGISTVDNLLNYDRRHGYRGPEKVLWGDVPVYDKEGKLIGTKYVAPLTGAQIAKVLDGVISYRDVEPAVVLAVNDRTIDVINKEDQQITIEWNGLVWARKYINDKRQGAAPKKASDIVKVGELVRIQPIPPEEPKTPPKKIASTEMVELPPIPKETQWRLSQVPAAQTAFVSISSDSGQVLALVGGFNFYHSAFNRATQALRQVGSSIKAFIYTAALDNGLNLASPINDAPITEWDVSLNGLWKPKNDPERYNGITRMRVGLAQSKNVMAIRVLRHTGIETTRQYLTKFGFNINDLPSGESLALGTASLTPLAMAQGYAAIADGGVFRDAYFIDHIADANDNLIYNVHYHGQCQSLCDKETAKTTIINNKETQVLTPQISFLAKNLLTSNIWDSGGTGWRAKKLGRHDLGGKTGTTNDAKDTWYIGYGPGIITAVWVGFDDNSRTLGRTIYDPTYGNTQQSGGEAGGNTAIGAWISYMRYALKDVPEQHETVPEGIFRMSVDEKTGLLPVSGSPTISEYFLRGTEPTTYPGANDSALQQNSNDDLFFN